MSRPVDLEAPDYTVDTWGSTVLLQLAPPSPSQALTIEIPLHLRYLPPSNHSGHGEIHVPDPIVFWACDAGDVDGGFANNPFDRTVLGYDALFADMTTFHHLEPESVTPGAPLRHAVSVPVLPLDQAGYVERGTAAAVIMGFLWIMWCAFGVWMKDVAVNAARARRPGTKKTQ